MAKILIVEDNALNIKLFCDLLAAHGHQPEAVTDSRNALDVGDDKIGRKASRDVQCVAAVGYSLRFVAMRCEQVAE